MYEIYKSTEGRKKTFLVFDGRESPDVAFKASAKYFRVSEDHIGFKACWILNGDLYFEDPVKKKAKKKFAFFWTK